MADYLPAFRVSGKSPAFAEQNFLARPESLFSYSHPKCKPLTKWVGGNAQDRETKGLNLCASLPGEGQVALAGLINNVDQTLTLSNWHS